MCNTNSQIKFRNTMSKSSVCDCNDAYILVKGTITLVGQGATEAARRQRDRYNKQVIFKNSAPFTGCINEISNTQADNPKDFDVAMPMYKLIKYSDNYSVITENLWQYHKDEPKDPITYSNSF